MNRPSSLIKVPSSLDGGSFFHWWIRFLSPFHDLTPREMDVAAELFKYRYELSKDVRDPVILDSLAVNSKARKIIESRLKLSRNYIKVIFSKLRRCKIIVDNRLNPKFIPNIKYNGNDKMLSVLLIFDFSDDGKKKV